MKSKFLLCTIALVPAASAFAQVYTNETDWRTAVQSSFQLENFDAFSDLTLVTALPTVGLSLDQLSTGQFGTVRSRGVVGGLARTDPNVLLNGPDFAGRGGDFVFRPTTDPLFAFGYWNTGGDDQTRLTLYRADDSVIATLLTPAVPENFSFMGIVSPEAFAYAVVAPLTGNSWMSIDDVQVSRIPAPSAGVLLALGAFMAARRGR